MPKVIITMCNGIISGVYSDSPVDFEVNICDSHDKYDDERSAQYFALQHQIQRGGLKDMLQATTHREASEKAPPCLEPNVFLLIREQNMSKTELGKEAQRLSAAFVDGYLSASSDLSKFILNLYKSKHPDAATAYHALIPLFDQQSRSYDLLCQELNQADVFDEVAVETMRIKARRLLNCKKENAKQHKGKMDI